MEQYLFADLNKLFVTKRRDTLYCAPRDSRRRRSTQAVLRVSADYCVQVNAFSCLFIVIIQTRKCEQMLAPFLPLLADEYHAARHQLAKVDSALLVSCQRNLLCLIRFTVGWLARRYATTRLV